MDKQKEFIETYKKDMAETNKKFSELYDALNKSSKIIEMQEEEITKLKDKALEDEEEKPKEDKEEVKPTESLDVEEPKKEEPVEEPTEEPKPEVVTEADNQVPNEQIDSAALMDRMAKLEAEVARLGAQHYRTDVTDITKGQEPTEKTATSVEVEEPKKPVVTESAKIKMGSALKEVFEAKGTNTKQKMYKEIYKKVF